MKRTSNMHIAFALLALLGIRVTQRLFTTSTGTRKTPPVPLPPPVTKQCSWTPRLHCEHELVTPHSLPQQLLQYDEPKTSTKLLIDCVVVGGEAAWDCGGCCGRGRV